ncbi:MAG: hypothetical protein J6Z38_02425, partial [Lachnospiraceae bacterium]|nr:hypothetical protein [Lachnospiraceae bacterium]
MRRVAALMLAFLLAAAFLTGCGQKPDKPHVRDDGRARPSSCGRLQVLNGKLCDEHGEAVMLRGVSLNGLITSESFLNEELFAELADEGVNLFRLPL